MIFSIVMAFIIVHIDQGANLKFPPTVKHMHVNYILAEKEINPRQVCVLFGLYLPSHLSKNSMIAFEVPSHQHLFIYNIQHLFKYMGISFAPV
jgi:hypothetical protein